MVVFFNINGTLIMDRLLQESSWEKAIFSNAQNPNPPTHDEFASILRKLGPLSTATLFLDDFNFSDIAAAKSKFYHDAFFQTPIELTNGLQPFKSLLSSLNIPYYIVTNSDRKDLQAYSVRYKDSNLNFLTDVFSAGLLNLNPKPSSELYAAAIKKLKLAPTSCVTFEDSIDGVTAASNAGINKIWLINGESGITPSSLNKPLRDSIVGMSEDFSSKELYLYIKSLVC